LHEREAMIRYEGVRPDVRRLVNVWIDERRREGKAGACVGDIQDVPRRGLMVKAAIFDGQATTTVSVELAAWLRAHGIAAEP
jgi:hypothetical protein